MKKLADIVTVAGAVGGSLLIASNTGHNLEGYALFLASSIAGTSSLGETGLNIVRLLNKVICYTKNAHPNRDERGLAVPP